MKLTPPQRQACQSLQEALLLQQRTSELDDGLWSPMVEGASTMFEDDELGDEDEEYEDLGENEPEYLELQTDLADNPVQRCVLNLLVSLFTHLPSGGDDKFYSPILRFVVLFSLKQNGQWLSGRRITQIFAALLFCGREVMMALMCNELIQRPRLRYSE